MTPRTRTMAALAMVGVLAWSTASVAYKGAADPPQAAAREPGPFVRVGGVILNVDRIESIEVQKIESGGELLTIYMAGQKQGARVRSRDAGDLYRAMRLPAP